jgi:cytoskeletal protein RodZ
MKGNLMRRITVVIVCAMIAPLAFAQTSATTKQTTTKQPKTTTETATTYTSGTVTKYEPGKTIVIQSNLAPVSFALGTGVRIVDGTGHVVTSVLKPGERVLVYYTGTGNTRTVEHIVAED